LAKINKHLVIFRDPETYSTFPWVTRSGSKLIVAFRQAYAFSVAAAKKGAVTHHDPNSAIMATVSLDEGNSWISPVEIYRSSYGVNDPALTSLRNGDLLLRVCELEVVKSAERAKLTGPITSHRAEHGLVASVKQNAVRRLSADLKPIWDSVVQAGEATRSASREPCVELPDQSLVLSVYKGAPQTTDRVYLVRSFDGGKTWGDGQCIIQDTEAGPSELQGINFNETSIAVVGSGEMMAMARADVSFHIAENYVPVGGVGQLFSSRSYNWGLSWTKPQPTGIFGQPAHLLVLDDGHVLCTYGHRKVPYGVCARLSRDKGVTWGDEIVLRSEGPMWDLGYPMTVALTNNRFLTVYYWNDESGTRFIAGTEWEL
jgi:hypothetical protein